MNTQLRPGRLIAWLSVFGILSALNYYGNLVEGGDVPEDVFFTYEFTAQSLSLAVILLGLMLLVARGLAWRDVFALRRPTSWRAGLGYAVALVVGTLVLGAALSEWLQPGEEQDLAPTDFDETRIGAFVLNALLVALVVPIVEELSFRGLGLSLLLPLGRWRAILICGALFALAHGLVEALPLFTIFGAALAWMRLRLDSVVPCIVTHAIINATAIALSLTLDTVG